MELPQVASLQDNAQSVVRAAQYVGRAADELRPLVVPAARTALEKVPGAASCAISRVKRVTPQTIREHSLAAGIVGGVLAAGLAAATVAHFVRRHKVARTYRLHRKHDALAAERAQLEKERAEFEKQKAAEADRAAKAAAKEEERAARAAEKEAERAQKAAEKEAERAARAAEKQREQAMKTVSSVIGQIGRETSRQLLRGLFGNLRK